MAPTNTDIVEPKDLGLRIGSQREVRFEKLRKALQEELDDCELTAELNKEFLKVMDTKISAEKKKV